MSYKVTNYDGGVTASPRQLVYIESVAQLQAVLRDPVQYPSPVRAMGSYHSLTPCASSDGTILDMSRFNRVLAIDHKNMTLTAQAGLQIIHASLALRAEKLQLYTNIEIGNMTVGSAACCHSKDALDGREFGQVSSYIARIKWVSPSGELMEASEDRDPELLYLIKSSYGLAGVIYEVTFRVKPAEIVSFTYTPRPVAALTEAEVTRILDRSEGLICWTVGKTAVFQNCRRADGIGPFSSLMAAGRRHLWNRTEASVSRAIARYAPTQPTRNLLQDGWFGVAKMMYGALSLTGGFHLHAYEKTVNYEHTSAAAKYVFTFWAFPRAEWLRNLRGYLLFADAHFKKYGFRCNMPLGSYYIRKDRHSLLSYSHDGDIFSIDPIHAPTDRAPWDRFLHQFNEFANQRGGVPLLNQSPFVTRQHVEAAYGPRWRQFTDFVRTGDPGGRMLNPFFAALLSQPAGRSAAT